ncbi:BZ3500_MvSof-1268-A1-R1_Chr8-1g09761 [Microbotryum saponariae]|uniref:protein-histidine N-methyltransferase n=1 Tax=Microbotryum saponariae TaxID=289078 RepID=A0A2X0KPI6_9BASI|nr:BZ3500_MvSof-1268-A1-R1_Chr8-1g09761 [Microbotryum saponariae]SDA08047.1 BZ3501_MvSof-1269-A2-R1_Chr8-1g09484 [Microbotryum saponariae]
MFSFDFDIPHDELELEDEEQQELVSSTQDLSISATPGTAAPASSQVAPSLIPSAKVELQDLIETLPPIISYSPVRIPLSPPNPPTSTSTSVSSDSFTETILLKRDLFDARFQILSDHSQKDRDDGDAKVERRKEDRSVEVESIDQDSDLVKGVYEGGLKVWECSLDLVRVLLRDGREGGRYRGWMGKRVLELGCGTALPACYAFAQILQEIREERDAERRNEQAQEAQTAEGRTQAKRERKKTRLDLQDYNRQGADLVQRVYPFITAFHSLTYQLTCFVDAVLSLITLPNLLLVYAHHLTLTDGGEGTEAQGVLVPTRKLKKKKKKSDEEDTIKEEDEVNEEDSESSEDDDEEDSDDDDDNDIREDDEAGTDFDPTADWRLHPGEIELSPGFLESFTTLLEDYGIELGFYEGAWEGFRSTSNIQSTSDQESRAEELEYDLVLASETIYQPASLPSHIDVLQRSKGEQLIACKRIYFGVGGGEVEFVTQVEGRGGKVETVWPGQEAGEQRMGVGRTVLRVGW